MGRVSRRAYGAQARRLFRELDGRRCAYCGVAVHRRGSTLDHVVPLSLGGVDAPWNLVTCCAPCNAGWGSIASTRKADAAAVVFAGRLRRWRRLSPRDRARVVARFGAPPDWSAEPEAELVSLRFGRGPGREGAG